jgi:hypothetical protein
VLEILMGIVPLKKPYHEYLLLYQRGRLPVQTNPLRPSVDLRPLLIPPILLRSLVVGGPRALALLEDDDHAEGIDVDADAVDLDVAVAVAAVVVAVAVAVAAAVVVAVAAVIAAAVVEPHPQQDTKYILVAQVRSED